MAQTLPDRMTRLEGNVEHLVDRIGRELEFAQATHDSIDKSLATLTIIAGRHDDRLNAIDKTIARALGAVAVLVILANILAPVIQRFLGIPM